MLIESSVCHTKIIKKEMTNKLTEQQTTMEFDLNSFIDSSSDDDNDNNNRTVDDILNDHDNTVSPNSPEPGPSSARSPDPYALSRRGGVSRPLPPLFSGVRSNVKPGVALAVAAAASRSVLTPHAAAIKSRRAKKLGLGSGVDVSGENLGGELRDTDGRGSSDRGGSVSEFELDVEGGGEEVCDEGRIGNGDESLVSLGSSISDSGIVVEEDVNLDEKNVTLDEGDGNLNGGLSDVSGEDVESVSCQEGFTNVTEAHDSNVSENGVLGSCKSGEDRLDDEYAREVDLDKRELDTGEQTLEENLLDSHSEDFGSELLNDIDALVEEVIGELETEIPSERNEESSRKFKKPLELAEELEKKQAFTGLHWEEGAAAQPMRLEGVRTGSVALGYFDIDADNLITRKISSTEFRRDYGSPQVLAVNLSYIAVGMSKGYIVAVPSRYSMHTVDNMEAKINLLGDRSYAPVTSICFSQQGDLLLAGYNDGRVVLWDVQRAVAAKVIYGEHTAPVVHTLIIGQDTQTARNFRAITGDGKGLVLLHAFSVRLLVNAFSVETKCLVNGQRRGMVLATSALLFDETSSTTSVSSPGNATLPSGGIGSMMGGVVGSDAGWKLFNKSSSFVEEDVVVFVTHQSAVVLKLHPKVEGCGQLPKPDGIREGSIPYTAWKSVSHSRGSSADPPNEAMERVSWLAIAWDRKIQVAKLVKSEHKSELKEHANWSLESPAIGVAWLDDQMLVVLTSTGQLALFEKDGTLIHQTSFAVYGGVDDIITYHNYFVNSFGNPEKAYHNCVSIRGASIYILGPTHLVVSRLLPWKERIQVLRKAGDWIGALNMGMTLYDGQAHGVIDLPRTLEAVQNALMPYLVELLLSYVDEVFSYISVAFQNQYEKMQQADDVNSRNNHVNSEIKEQFTRVGGVAVEFCAHIKRTDILFDDIFAKFGGVQHKDTFLELLEPYILKDMLGSLPPEIMQALVEHYSTKGWLQRVEQCVLHMDISSLDFNQVVRLCQEHGLYGALVYLFNKGLDDFRTPLEELLGVLKKSKTDTTIKLGYRILVYLKYCFLGLAFPPGHGALTSSRVPSLRKELVQFLLETSDSPTSEAAVNLSSKQAFLNLYHLLEIDTEATLDVLRCAFLEDDSMSNREMSSQSTACEMIETDKDGVLKANSQNCLVQDTVNAFVNIIKLGIYDIHRFTAADDMGKVESWPAKKDIGYLFEFIAYYVTDGRAKVSKDVLSLIVEYFTSKDTLPPSLSINDAEALQKKEKQLLALLKAVPDIDWSPPYVLQLCEKAQFYQISGFIHTLKQQYIAALDSYMNCMDEPIHAFAFINNILQQLNDVESSTFRSAVISRISKLIELSRECSFFLVMDHFKEEESYILQELRPHSKSLFLYLKTYIEAYLSGTLNFSYLTKDDMYNRKWMKDHSNVLEVYLERLSVFPKFLCNNPFDVTDDLIELYLELLCQYERASVLKFLETFDNYRVENCLRICQEHGIIDAAAFLLERVGDVGSALLLTLSCLNDKFLALDTAVGNIVSSLCSSSSRKTDCWRTISGTKERNDIFDIVHACIKLCQRNTPRLNPEESEALWFKLLDSFCEPMMGSSGNKLMSEKSNDVQRQATSLGPIEVEVACTISWKITKSNRGANVLRRLFSEFIKDIVEGMIGYVPLPNIMSKLLSNGSHEFGDFKSTILGMLGTYGFERQIMDTAKSLIEDDTFYTMSILKKEASHGYSPRSLMCCICNCPLTKNSSLPSIRVFNCGHATHIQCEFLENDTKSRGLSSGCPVCMPKKKAPKSRDKSVLPDNSLVKSTPLHQQIPGTAPSFHDSDFTENSHGFQQISRFEMLSKLHKDQKSIQIENMPLLRLAPPAVYHEKVKKGSVLVTGESSKNPKKAEEQTKSRRLRDLKVKGSSLHLPLKSSIFGKQKTSRH